jgi:dipeptidyl aminopeptidase/acylaminoacyl peptidase
MRKCLLLYCFSFFNVNSFAQKLPIDSSTIANWTTLSSPSISNDGSYFLYVIKNRPIGSSTLAVKSIKGSWSAEFVNIDNGFFSPDSKRVVYKSFDTIYFTGLGTSTQDYIKNVTSYKAPISKKGWIACELNNENKECILKNTITGEEQRFTKVIDYLFNESGSALLIIRKTNLDEINLVWVDLIDGSNNSIWSNYPLSQDLKIGNISFDKEGQQVAFIVINKAQNRTDNSIWYYKKGMGKAILIYENTQADSGLVIKNTIPQFSKNGRYLFCLLEEANNKVGSPNGVKVDVWNYKDVFLQSEQLQKLEPETFYSVINLENKKSFRIEQIDEKNKVLPQQVKGDYIVTSTFNSLINKWWDSTKQKSFYLVSLQDGTKKLIKKCNVLEGIDNISFSPKGEYLVYYDRKEKNYFSYHIPSNVFTNITKRVKERLSNENADDLPGLYNSAVGIGGWLQYENAEVLLIYDNYDIWEIDPSGKRTPYNITNGYGLRSHIKFRLVFEKEAMDGLQRDEHLLLTAFNTLNKYNGFFKVDLINKKELELLTMGPYTFYHTDSQLPFFALELSYTMKPMKAGDVNLWIVERMSASEPPNFFLTSDFKSYTSLTYFQPQSNCNWLSSELINWKQLDGSISQGVLYKPSNFDSHKKYPIIFNYYEKMSHRLYEFPEPGFTTNTINIPWFVSRGYIVFTPDIHYKVGKIGQSAYNSVVSAAKYLSKMAWVDSTKMALQGHSFAGFETNYLVTHTNMFICAAEAAGTSNQISSYGTLSGRGANRQSTAEFNQGRFGATIWQQPNLYISNSPIFKADKVVTPLFIMHNKKDLAVPFAQGIEFYMALRRLDKKVWLLQYDEAGHSLSGKEAIDYTIRLSQFFDHYLKGRPAPRWMTVGIPAAMKGTITGYDLSPEGSCAMEGKNECSVCKKWNELYWKNPEMFSKPLSVLKSE